ncbi:MAG: EAL domain-containing protein [Rubrivivax sp.]|nr:EAL domain-containing protein [Rubrivivax sp.]
MRRSDAERRFRALLEHAGEAMVVCNAAGKVQAVNGAAASLLAEAPPALLGKPVMPWLHQAVGPGGDSFVLRNGEATLHTRQASDRPVQLRITRLPGTGGGQWLVALRDDAARRHNQDSVDSHANFDSLTGLPNRTLFRDRLSQAMARSQRTGRPMALMFLDLDRFKVINDSLGHEAGDRLLQHVSRTLTQSLRDVDTVSRMVDAEPFTLSRLGGDEFTVIAEGIDGAEDATLVACRLLEALSTPFRLGDEEVVISASVGISIYPTDDVDLDTLVRHTDMAMYRAKSLGRGTYSFFSDDLNAAVAARLSLEGALRRATERQEFILHFQPKACLQTGTVTGVEALLRWHCPGQGLVPPDRFISVLEDTGLILPVGAWVIRAACAQLNAWDRMGLPRLRMAVNLSARQFRHLYLASMVEDTLREYYIEPERLEIELTESLLMEDNETTRGMLASFARLGVRMAIDDFGTGHSSLSYLKRFNIDTLKIDRSFVQSLPSSSEDLAISTAVIAMARSMQMSVVAEGVETEPQAQILRELGCHEMQGYLLSRPLPPADLAAWLQKRLRADEARKLTVGRDIGEPLALMTIEAMA